MPVLRVSIHPMGLHPVEAVKAWHKHLNDGMSLDDILQEGEIVNLHGVSPGRYALWAAIQRVKRMSDVDLLPCVSYFLFGSFRLELKPPVQVKQFPNEIEDCVSDYML